MNAPFLIWHIWTGTHSIEGSRQQERINTPDIRLTPRRGEGFQTKEKKTLKGEIGYFPWEIETITPLITKMTPFPLSKPVIFPILRSVLSINSLLKNVLNLNFFFPLKKKTPLLLLLLRARPRK